MIDRKSVYIVLFNNNAVFSYRDMSEKRRKLYYKIKEYDFEIYNFTGSSFIKYKGAYNLKRRIDRWMNKYFPFRDEKARVIRVLL